MTRLPKVDAVVVGVGWAGGILAKELAQAGLKVVGLERGRFRQTNPGFQPPQVDDELKYHTRHELMQDLSRETLTFRNSRDQTALPMRQLGSFMLGDGLGGAGVHWNGVTWRYLPYDFEIRSRTVARYGRDALPENSTLHDWGVTYGELEPYYDRFEYLCGISGEAGNLRGERQAGGNPFEGPRERPYPTPALTPSYAGVRFGEAARSLGYSPFMYPAANVSEPYTNPDGVELGACVYCGYCTRFGCKTYAKPSALITALPAAQRTGNFELRTHANVIRVNTDASGGRATGVTYVDAAGREVEQPADLVLLTSYVFNNVRLLLLSGIGTPYNPGTGEGVVGRNYTYQAFTSAFVFFDDAYFNTFMGAGALGSSFDDLNGDNFDHAGLGFIHGGNVATTTAGDGPVRFQPTPPGTPRWGAAWKDAVATYYNRAWTIGVQGSVMPYRSNYLDLDPTYRDAYGQPLLRMTFDWGPNEHAMSRYMVGKLKPLVAALKPSHSAVYPVSEHYSTVPYQSTHNVGGAVMGTDPATSVVNPFLQSWDVPNLFVVGASAFPHNPGYNPTGTVGAVAFRTADAAKRYLGRPGALA